MAVASASESEAAHPARPLLVGRIRASRLSPGASSLAYPSRHHVPPRWPDEQGRPLPTYPCPRCGRDVAVRFRGFRVEHLRHVGWQLFRSATYINWCGHGKEVIQMTLADSRVY